MLKAAAKAIGALGLVAVVVVFSAGPAFAHAVLESTNPVDGSIYPTSAPPTTASMHWGESVGIKLGAVRVYDEHGKLVNTGAPIHPNGDDSTVSVSLPHLAAGTYVVSWRVISADTHPVSGAFTFTVGTQKQNVNALATRILSSANGSKTVGVLYGIDRFCVFASLLSLLGGAAFLALVWPEGRRSRRAARILWIALIAGVVVTLFGFAIEGIYAAAFPLRELFNTTVLRDTFHARYGETALSRVALLVLAIPMVRVLVAPTGDENEPARAPRPWWYLAATVVGIATVATVTLASHGTTGRWTGIAVPADVFHVSAVSLWFGGLLMLTAAMLPSANVHTLNRALPRYSNFATGAVIAIVLSGTFQAIRQVGTLHALASTTYGHLLIAKLVAFSALIVVATFSREIVDRVYEPRRVALKLEAQLVGAGAPVPPLSPVTLVDIDPPDNPSDAATDEMALRRVRRTVRIEVAIAVIVLIFTALLVDARPAYEITTGPQILTLKSSPQYPPVVWFNVVVEPATRGLNQIHLTTETPEGGVASPLQATMELTNAKRDLGPLEVTLVRIGPGHYTASYLIPFAGTWQITIKALMTQIDESTATHNVTIR